MDRETKCDLYSKIKAFLFKERLVQQTKVNANTFIEQTMRL